SGPAEAGSVALLSQGSGGGGSSPWSTAQRDQVLADATAAKTAAEDVQANRSLASADYATAASQSLIMGATFDTATDSLEALRDRGDAAWTTGSGGGGSSPWSLAQRDQVLADAAAAKTDAAAAKTAAEDVQANRTLVAADYATSANQILIMGATFNSASDSLEAIRVRGDVAWTTGSGGGGGTTDWTATERDQIRYRLGVDGTKATPTGDGPELEITISPTTIVDANTPTVDSGLSFSITQRDDYENDSDIGPVGPIRVQTDLPLLRPTDPPRLRFGATNKRGQRFGNTHFIGTAYAEAVSGESDQYDLFIELTAEELDKAPGVYGWDIEAVFTDNDVRTVIEGELNLRRSMGDNEQRDPQN
ncbi:MAG: hypothetical protein AAGA03_19575, partial [Planctomycetota bacterium]